MRPNMRLGREVLTLALGIGATTSLFGVAEQVLIAPLPYGDPTSALSSQAWQ